MQSRWFQGRSKLSNFVHMIKSPLTDVLWSVQLQCSWAVKQLKPIKYCFINKRIHSIHQKKIGFVWTELYIMIRRAKYCHKQKTIIIYKCSVNNNFFISTAAWSYHWANIRNAQMEMLLGQPIRSLFHNELSWQCTEVPVSTCVT